MNYTNKNFIELIPKGDRRALARLITLIEQGDERIEEVKSALFKKGGNAHIVGVTGAPGSGKSTLVDALSKTLIEQGFSVAVLAVDPSSPFSGGAILGDRIRMAESAMSENVFIRSLATRGYLGGLSKSAYDAIQVCDSAAFDFIVLETVGVGQAEIDIAKTAQTTALVLVPGMGDSVQAMKAGVLEIADIFILNKSDKEGIERLHKEIKTMLSLSTMRNSWETPIIRTIATTHVGVTEAINSFSQHREWLTQTDEGLEKQVKIMEAQLLRLLSNKVIERIFSKSGNLLGSAKSCVERKIDPYTLVDKTVEEVL